MRKQVDKVIQNSEPVAQPVFETMRAVMHLYRAQQLRTPAAGGQELAPMEGRVLGYFARHPGATLSDLVTESQRDKAQLTRLIRALREKNLLLAEADPADRRSTRLRPSAEGEALHRAWQAQHAQGARLALAGLNDAECAQLQALLQRVQQTLQQASGAES